MPRTQQTQALQDKWNAPEQMTFAQACYNFTKVMQECSEWPQAFEEGNPTMRDRIKAAAKSARQASRDLEMTINRRKD